MSVLGHKPSRKRVNAVFAQAGRWTLVIVVFGFAVIGSSRSLAGSPSITSRTSVPTVRRLAVTEPQFPLVVTMLAGASLAQGHRVALNGDGTYSRLREDLRSARQSITPRAGSDLGDPLTVNTLEL